MKNSKQTATAARSKRVARVSIEYADGREHCPSCQGLISYDRSMKDRLPIGLGFLGARFQVDYMERSGHGGECMDCGLAIFAIVTRRHVTRFPRSINSKIGGLK